jgi:pimeloyl-ACP methyl ester carboxylesterase
MASHESVSKETAQAIRALGWKRGEPVGRIFRADRLSIDGSPGYLVLDGMLLYEVTFIPEDLSKPIQRLHMPTLQSYSDFEKEYERHRELFRNGRYISAGATYALNVEEHARGTQLNDALVIVTGFTTENKTASEWAAAVTRTGWTGTVLSVNWRSGDWAHEWSYVKAQVPGDAAIASHILRSRNYRSVRVLGHSLGAAVAVEIARSFGSLGGTLAGLALFSAALPASEVHAAAISSVQPGNAFNVYNPNDRVLKDIYDFWGDSAPMGVGPANAGSATGLTNIRAPDSMPKDRIGSHSAYPQHMHEIVPQMASFFGVRV